MLRTLAWRDTARYAAMIILKSGVYLEDGGNVLLNLFFFFNFLKPSSNIMYHHV